MIVEAERILVKIFLEFESTYNLFAASCGKVGMGRLVTLKQNNNPAEAVPKSSRGWKWKNLLRRIWKDKSQYEGQGIGTTVDRKSVV